MLLCYYTGSVYTDPYQVKNGTLFRLHFLFHDQWQNYSQICQLFCWCHAMIFSPQWARVSSVMLSGDADICQARPTSYTCCKKRPHPSTPTTRRTPWPWKAPKASWVRKCPNFVVFCQFLMILSNISLGYLKFCLTFDFIKFKIFQYFLET